MDESTWTDQIQAWSALATAMLTAILVGLAWWAGATAVKALRASRQASDAAADAAREARAANEQARLDSIEQTRPYVYVEVVPGLAGMTTWDVRIANTGRSSAYALTLDHSDWPQVLDDVGRSVRTLFTTPRTLPPGCAIRACWRLEGDFGDGTTEAGMPRSNGVITTSYTSTDPSAPQYGDDFDVMIDSSGLWPIGEQGIEPGGLKGDMRKFYLLGQVLVRRIAELGR